MGLRACRWPACFKTVSATMIYWLITRSRWRHTCLGHFHVYVFRDRLASTQRHYWIPSPPVDRSFSPGGLVPDFSRSPPAGELLGSSNALPISWSQRGRSEVRLQGKGHRQELFHYFSNLVWETSWLCWIYGWINLPNMKLSIVIVDLGAYCNILKSRRR